MSLANMHLITSGDDEPVRIVDTALESMYVAMMEDTLTESEIEEAIEECVDTGDVILERSIVKLDKAAKKSKAYSQAVLRIAAEEDPKNFAKYKEFRRSCKYLFAKWEKKYGHKAKAMVRTAGNKMRASGTRTGDRVATRSSNGLIVASKPSKSNTSRKLASSNLATRDKYATARANKYNLSDAKINQISNKTKNLR